MMINFGTPCSKCGVGFYLELEIKTPREVQCYNCKHCLPYVKEAPNLYKVKITLPFSQPKEEQKEVTEDPWTE